MRITGLLISISFALLFGVAQASVVPTDHAYFQACQKAAANAKHLSYSKIYAICEKSADYLLDRVQAESGEDQQTERFMASSCITVKALTESSLGDAVTAQEDAIIASSGLTRVIQQSTQANIVTAARNQLAILVRRFGQSR